MKRCSKTIIFLVSISLILIKCQNSSQISVTNNGNKSTIILNKNIPMINKSFPHQKKLEFFSVSKYKLGVCLIGKNFSTMMTKILCSLMSGKNFLFQYTFKDCGRGKRYINSTTMALKNKMSNDDALFKQWSMIMIVRNPIDRLISGFMQLCYFRIHLKDSEDYCYGCNKDINCFVDQLYKELTDVHNGTAIPDQFNDFHFYPQTWQCEYYKHKEEYTYIKYLSKNKKKFYDDLMNHLSKVNVPSDHISYISGMIKKMKTLHETESKKATKEYKLMLMKNSTLIGKICSIFHNDFIEFNFDYPEECLNNIVINDKSI